MARKSLSILRDNPLSPTLTNATTTTETVVARWSVPANEFTANDFWGLKWFGQVASTATLTTRVRVGPLGTIADPLAIAFGVTAAGVLNNTLALTYSS
jgi:hypothetical protein